MCRLHNARLSISLPLGLLTNKAENDTKQAFHISGPQPLSPPRQREAIFIRGTHDLSHQALRLRDQMLAVEGLKRVVPSQSYTVQSERCRRVVLGCCQRGDAGSQLLSSIAKIGPLRTFIIPLLYQEKKNIKRLNPPFSTQNPSLEYLHFSTPPPSNRNPFPLHAPNPSPPPNAHPCKIAKRILFLIRHVGLFLVSVVPGDCCAIDTLAMA